MRVLLLVIALVTACGGASQRPAATARALERVVVTLPDDVSLVAIADEQRLRSSALLAPYWNDLERYLASTAPHCRDAMPMRGVAVVALHKRGVIVWALGVDAASVRACMAQLAASPPAGIRADLRDDFLAFEMASTHGGAVVTGDTLVVVATDHAIARGDVLAAMQPHATHMHPELARVVNASNALAVWVSGKLLAPITNPELAATFAIDFTERAVAELRIQMSSAKAAAAELDKTRAQLAELQAQHVVDAIDAHVDGATLSASVIVEGDTARTVIDSLRSGRALPTTAAPPDDAAKPLFERVDRAALERVGDRALEILLEDPRITAIRTADRGAFRTQLIERICRDIGGGCKPAPPVGRPLQPDELAAVREALDRALVQAGIAERDRADLAPITRAVAPLLRLP